MSVYRGESVVDPQLPGSTVVVSSGVFAATTVPTIIFIADNTYDVVGVREVHTTASNTGTLTVEKLSGTTAPSSGNVLLTATISTAGAANTVLNGTVVVTTPAFHRLIAGDRLALKSGGDQTGLANAVVSITLKRV